MQLDVAQLVEAWSDADVVELRYDCLVLVQHKNRQGVCIIPERQGVAACEIIRMIGRGEPTTVSGSKRGSLVYSFSPPLTEDEYSEIEDATA